MGRHSQLSRQQMVDQLDHAFIELEDMACLFIGLVESGEYYSPERAEFLNDLAEKLEPRVDALSKHLSEYD